MPEDGRGERNRIQPRLKRMRVRRTTTNARGGSNFPLFLCLENLKRASPARHLFLPVPNDNTLTTETNTFLTMTTTNNNSGSVDFRQLLNEETSILTNLCQKWEDKLKEHEVDEEGGHSKEEEDVVTSTAAAADAAIRGVVGQCKMLLHPSKGRLAQFRNLIQQSERPQTRSQTAKGVQSISDEDLQGFWDMISFQIDDVKRDFQRLEVEEPQKHRDTCDNYGEETPSTLVQGFEDLQIREDKKVDDVGPAAAASKKVTKPTKPSWNNKSGRPTNSSSASRSTNKTTTSASSSSNKKAAAAGGGGNIRDFIAQKRLEAQKKKESSNDNNDNDAGFLVM